MTYRLANGQSVSGQCLQISARMRLEPSSLGSAVSASCRRNRPTPRFRQAFAPISACMILTSCGTKSTPRVNAWTLIGDLFSYLRPRLRIMPNFKNYSAFLLCLKADIGNYLDQRLYGKAQFYQHLVELSPCPRLNTGWV